MLLHEIKGNPVREGLHLNYLLSSALSLQACPLKLLHHFPVLLPLCCGLVGSSSKCFFFFFLEEKDGIDLLKSTDGKHYLEE